MIRCNDASVFSHFCAGEVAFSWGTMRFYPLSETSVINSPAAHTLLFWRQRLPPSCSEQVTEHFAPVCWLFLALRWEEQHLDRPLQNPQNNCSSWLASLKQFSNIRSSFARLFMALSQTRMWLISESYHHLLCTTACNMNACLSVNQPCESSLRGPPTVCNFTLQSSTQPPSKLISSAGDGDGVLMRGISRHVAFQQHDVVEQNPTRSNNRVWIAVQASWVYRSEIWWEGLKARNQCG